jgi:hypothetical protein
MAIEPADQTLDATALVHEAWLRLQKSTPDTWRDRKQLFTAAAGSPQNGAVAKQACPSTGSTYHRRWPMSACSVSAKSSTSSRQKMRCRRASRLSTFVIAKGFPAQHSSVL